MGSGGPATGQLEYQISFAFFQNFQRYEDLNAYLINVGRVLMSERDKIALLFKRIQDAFADLFIHSRLLYQEVKDLELLKDYFRLRVDYLKTQVAQAQQERDEYERVCRLERGLKEEYMGKLDRAEKRMVEAEAEAEGGRRRSERQEEEQMRLRRQVYKLESERDEAGDKRAIEVARMQKRMEQVMAERNKLKTVVAEYHKFMRVVVDQVELSGQ